MLTAVPSFKNPLTPLLLTPIKKPDRIQKVKHYAEYILFFMYLSISVELARTFFKKTGFFLVSYEQY